MTRNGTSDIKVRRITFSYPEGAMNHLYADGDLILSHLVAVLSALFPEGRTVQDAVEVADLASQGIYEGTCPFRVDWASASPLVVAQRVFRQQLKNMAADPADPSISLTVYLKSLLLPVIGKANIECIDVDSSSAETGSWLGREFQGRGYGTEARNAVLSLVFALGLDRSNTFVYQSNAASQRVTEKVGGYVLEDIDHSNGRENDPTLRYMMTRRAWEAVPRPEVVISGMQDARAVLGLV